VLSGKVRGDGFDLSIGGDDPTDIRCRYLVNAAGLYAPALAHAIERVPRETIPQAYFRRGVYFTLTGRAPFRRLIYPVPGSSGLGIHVTLDMAGQALFGPGGEWISSVDYAVDPARGRAFYTAVLSYWPGFRDGSLQLGCAGIRPKISGPADPAADFVVGPREPRRSRAYKLYGIESPGLTASLALADEVLQKLAPCTNAEN
jgi:L-2-hydroxyglutarate oxidase LhgO